MNTGLTPRKKDGRRYRLCKIRQAIVVPGLPIVDRRYLLECLRQLQTRWSTHRIVYVGVEQRWLDELKEHELTDSLCIGEQRNGINPTLLTENTSNIPQPGAKSAPKRCAIKKVDTNANHPQHLHDALDTLVRKWRERHHLATFAFMVDLRSV